MSDTRDRFRHRPIDSYCQLCGDSGTWKFSTVSGLNRHCVMVHAHIFTRSGGYRPIPAEHIRLYQDRVRAGRSASRKTRGSLNNNDRHPSWTVYPSPSASVESPAVANLAQVSVIQVCEPYLPPPPPTLPSSEVLASGCSRHGLALSLLRSCPSTTSSRPRCARDHSRRRPWLTHWSVTFRVQPERTLWSIC